MKLSERGVEGYARRKKRQSEISRSKEEDEKRQKVNDTETLCTLQNVLQQKDKHGEMS